MAIDRCSLVRRHNPVLRSFDPRSPLSIGNGEFAFTVDGTGLQTFRARYEESVPLCTQAQWGWHSFPSTGKEEALQLEDYDAGGRTVRYATRSSGQQETFARLRRNPHRLNLGAIGFLFSHPGSPQPEPESIENPYQELDLWTGVILSRWCVSGAPVMAATCCHPRRDAVSIRAESPLFAAAMVGVEIAFPYGSPEMSASDWSSPEQHCSETFESGPRLLGIRRTLDATQYACFIHLGSGAVARRNGEHSFLIHASPGKERLSIVVEFSPRADPREALWSEEVEAESAES